MRTRLLPAVVAAAATLSCHAWAAAVDAADAYQKGDYAAVLRTCEAPARAGDAGCQDFMGLLYAEGKGVKADLAEAVHWFRLSAEQGNAVGAYNLGHAYEFGAGVSVDPKEAAKWYAVAAKQGLASAQARLGYLAIEYEHDWKNGIKLIRPATAQGVPDAQFTLGLAYELGTGVRRNDRLAVKWYAAAADRGFTAAQSRLAGFYERGAGVEVDYKEAYFWYAVALRDPKNPTRKQDEAALKRVGAHLSAADLADAAKIARAWRPEVAMAGPPQRRTRRSASRTKARGPRLYATGTGFYVTRDGALITNNHVVAQCAAMRISNGGQGLPATVVATDSDRDLALLRGPHKVDAAAVFRGDDKLQLGETVVVVGFPLAGLLSSDPIVTSGIVSALAGLRDNRRELQISAPVQPGNSGGPLFDDTGRIAGVVVATLDSVRVARAIGVMPENVNFAIKAEEARAFLAAHGIKVERAPAGAPLSTAAIAAQALKLTVRLECWK